MLCKHIADVCTHAYRFQSNIHHFPTVPDPLRIKHESNQICHKI